jgi:hypothetical protein
MTIRTSNISIQHNKKTTRWNDSMNQLHTPETTTRLKDHTMEWQRGTEWQQGTERHEKRDGETWTDQRRKGRGGNGLMYR